MRSRKIINYQEQPDPDGVASGGNSGNSGNSGNRSPRAFTGLGIAGQALSSIGSAIQKSGKHQLDPTAAALKDAQNQALGMIPPPAGMALQAASGITSAIAGMTGKTLDGVSTGDKIVSSIPIVGDLMSLFSSSLPKFSYDKDKIGSDFSTSKLDEAADLSGKNMLFGSGKYKQKIYDAKLKRDAMSQVTKENRRRLENDMSSQYNDVNALRFSGQNQVLSLSARKGIKFPELDEARSILDSLKTREPKIEKHQNGGVLGEKNFIPEGKLHAHKHSLVIDNPELKGKITEKGIPVVSQAEGGEITQQAEVEKEEIVMSKSTTNELESMFERYKQAEGTEKDQIAIEAGKYLVEQILKNTEDRAGIIKTVE